MSKDFISTCQPNNSLVYSEFQDFYNKNTTLSVYLNKNINSIADIYSNKNMIKSIPIVNANRSMHPLLLPNYNQVSTTTNIYPTTTTNIQHYTTGTLPSYNVQSTSNGGTCLPIKGNNDYHTNLTVVQNQHPAYQQRYLKSDISQTNNLSYSTDTSVGTTNPYFILAGDDMSSSQNITQLSYPTYNIVRNTSLSSVSPAFFNKNLPHHPRKRQRLGPSCDTCRSRKVKCDAKIEILYEDDRIINEISDKLIYILKPSEVKELSRTVLRYHALPEELFVEGAKDSSEDGNTSNSAKKHYRLLKHINKIVLFQPCSSCVRLKNHRKKTSCANKWKVDHCSFSRGLTKSDTSIFDEIHKVTGKNLDEMTVEDFRTTCLRSSFRL